MRAAWILLVVGLFWQGYAQLELDYALSFGGFEVGTRGDGIADGWSVWRNFGGSATHSELGLHFRMTRARAVEGQRSQEIQISRSSGDRGLFHFSATAINTDWETSLYPPIGSPLLVRMWVQTENLTNTEVVAFVISGQRFVSIATLPTNSGGWVPLSMVVPLEVNAEGRPLFRVGLEVRLGTGAASGRIWVDGLEVIWHGFNRTERARPNMLKIAHVNTPVPHWQMLLSPPVEFLITTPSQTVALQGYLPNADMAVYVNAAQTTNRTPTPWNDLYGGYNFVIQNHPSWLLRRSGEPFSNPAYPDLWPLDIGIPAVRQQAITRLNEIAQAIPLPNWLFFDNSGSWWQCDQYPRREDILPRWTEYFQSVFTHVRQNLNRKVVINAGSHAGAFIDGNQGTQWIQYVDAVVLEHVITFLGGTPRAFRYQSYRLDRAISPHTDATWWATLRAINAYPDKKWIIMAMTHPNTYPEMFRYVLASYFLMAHENTYLMVEARETGEENLYHLWLNRPEVWVPLGNPRGSWRVVAGTASDASGALFARDFEHGVVLVNPTDPDPNDPSRNRVYEFTLPRTYKNWDGQVVPAGTRIQIGPKTGLVFYAAPEIRISISPQQVTALPGETVTFTVQYRNDGLADGTNIRISVPLPEGLEFVSSSTGGQFLNRQITWTLPQVRVGQSGTLTFQARVQ